MLHRAFSHGFSEDFPVLRISHSIAGGVHNWGIPNSWMVKEDFRVSYGMFFLGGVPTVPNRDIITWEFTMRNPQLRDGDWSHLGEIHDWGIVVGNSEKLVVVNSSKGSQIQVISKSNLILFLITIGFFTKIYN